MIEPRKGVADCFVEVGEQGWWLTCSLVMPRFVRRPAIVVGYARSSELIKFVIRTVVRECVLNANGSSRRNAPNVQLLQRPWRRQLGGSLGRRKLQNPKSRSASRDPCNSGCLQQRCRVRFAKLTSHSCISRGRNRIKGRPTARMRALTCVVGLSFLEIRWLAAPEHWTRLLI